VYTRPTEPRSIGGCSMTAEAVAGCLFQGLAHRDHGTGFVGDPAAHLLGPVGATLGGQQPAVAMMRSSAGLSLAYLVFSIASIGFHNAVIAQTDATTKTEGQTIGQSLSIGFRLLGRAFLMGLLIALPSRCRWCVVCHTDRRFHDGAPDRWRRGIPGVVLRSRENHPGCGDFDRRGQGSAESLGRSWTLTAGHWWRVAIILTVLVIVIVALFLFIGIIAGIVAAAWGQPPEYQEC